jgi:peptidoglycan/xylan/chitin deacetylase (PgdA/CDA1 family)
MNPARALPVLMYHHVSDAPGLVTVSPQNFHAQMAWLADHGYNTVGCADVAAFLAGEPLPEKSVVVTFDDGYLDNYIYGHPVLAALGLKAVLFIVTGRMGEGPARKSAPTPSHAECMARVKAGRADDVMLRWSEVETMAAAGTFEFHSHTHGHKRWDRDVADPAARADALAEDLRRSRATLERRLGSGSRHLCWPEGYHDADYRRVAKAAGFDHLYTVEKGTCTRATPPDRIPRIVVKDRAEDWFGRRLWLYRQPKLTAAYLRLKGG